jgi:hypothetical protein
MELQDKFTSIGRFDKALVAAKASPSKKAWRDACEASFRGHGVSNFYDLMEESESDVLRLRDSRAYK